VNQRLDHYFLMTKRDFCKKAEKKEDNYKAEKKRRQL